MIGLLGMKNRLSVLEMETQTADLEKMSGMWLRWRWGHWAPSGHWDASPDKYGKKIWKLQLMFILFPMKIKDLGFSNIYMFIILK